MLGDRNGKLEALKGRQWDVVIDIPTTLPVWVRDAAEVLKGNVGRYVFISTISVYSDNSKPGMDETGPLAKYEGADAMKETRETLLASKFALYGPLKVQSEREAEKWFPGQTLIIRPGLIVGPGDETDRFTYWPVRVDRGGEIMAPGNPSDPVQFIDARDLAEWTIRMVEQGNVGTFNATGPKSKLSIQQMLEGIKKVTTAASSFTWSTPISRLRKRWRRGVTCRFGFRRRAMRQVSSQSTSIGRWLRGSLSGPCRTPRRLRSSGSGSRRRNGKQSCARELLQSGKLKYWRRGTPKRKADPITEPLLVL